MATRQVIRGLMAAFGAALLVGSLPGTAAASCAGPQFFVSPALAAPGTTVVVSGFGFTPDCNDNGQPGDLVPGQPYENVEFVVRVVESEKAVGRLTVSPDLDFAVVVNIPPSLGTGPGEIRVTTGGDSPQVLATAPIEVTGQPADRIDIPYRDLTVVGVEEAPKEGVASAKPWPWIGLGAIVGGSVALLVVWLARRRRS